MYDRRHRDQRLWPMASTPFTVRKNIMITTFPLFHFFAFFFVSSMNNTTSDMHHPILLPWPLLAMNIITNLPGHPIHLPWRHGSLYEHHQKDLPYHYSPSWSCPRPSSPSFSSPPSLSECAPRTSAGSQPTKRGIQLQIQLRKEASFLVNLGTMFETSSLTVPLNCSSCLQSIKHM